jgi:hypothetical protein
MGFTTADKATTSAQIYAGVSIRKYVEVFVD